MTIASNLGFPRIGRRRELKTALEQFWRGAIDGEALLAIGARLRATHWRQQVGHGIGHVPSGDFSLYDHVLDTACMLGAIPPGYGWDGGPVSLETSFRPRTRLAFVAGDGQRRAQCAGAGDDEVV